MVERIDILIEDKVSAAISHKLDDMATKAKRAYINVEKLAKELLGLNSNSPQKLAADMNKLSNAVEKQTKVQSSLVVSTEKQVLSQDKLNRSWLQTEAALQRGIAAETRAQMAQQKLNNESKKGDIIQQRLASEIQKTAAAQNRTAASAARTAAAEDRARLTALRLDNAHKKLNSTVKRTDNDFSGFIRTLIAYAGITFGTRELLDIGDTYTLLQNKIKNVTESEGQLTAVTKQVFDVANETRTEIDATANAFQRFDRALINLGASQTESIRLTKTINELLASGGATTSEQTAGLLQLSQAFNKGKADGDEFRTMMELMPGVVDAIAKEMKVTRGELLNLAPEGKITSEVMRKALASVADEADRKFAKLKPTISQAFVVGKNKAVEFFGELSKKYKITETFANLVLKLSDNMGALAVGLTVVLGILGFGFAPALMKGLVALKGFTLAVATNPMALFVIGLTAAITYLAIFKDEIYVNEQEMITFGDTVNGVFSVIRQELQPTVEYFKNAWQDAFNFSSKDVNEFEKTTGNVFSNIIDIVKGALNIILSIHFATWKSIYDIWSDLPKFFKNIFFLGVNGAIDAMNNLIKVMTIGFRVPIKILNELLDRMGKDKINLDEFIQIPKLEVVERDVTKVFDKISNNFKTAFEMDHIGDVVTDFTAKVKKASEEARDLRVLSGRGFDSYDPSKPPVPNRQRQTTPDNKGKGKSYSDIINENIRAIESERKALNYLGAEYNVFTKVEQLNNQLLSQKKKLKEEDRQNITKMLTALEREKAVHSELNKIYEETVGVRRNLFISAEAINQAYERGFYTTKQYQNKLQDLNDQTVLLNADNKTYARLFEEVVLKNRELTAAVEGLTKAYSDGIISLSSFKKEIYDLKMEMIETSITMDNATGEEIILSSLNRIVEGYHNASTSIRNSFGDLFVNLSDGFADSIGKAIVMGDDLGDSLRNVARSAISELISQIIKMGIQWATTQALQSAVSSAALTASTVASAAAAKATALAWATPAALASLGSFGGNAAPAEIGMGSVITSAITAASAGFKTGGYTGNYPTDDIAGFVHGREYVIDAKAVERIGLNNLEALRSGNARVARNEGKQTNSTNKTTVVQGESNVTVTPKIVNILDPSLVGDYLATPQGEELILNVMVRNGYVR